MPLTIIIPTLNEGSNLKKILPYLIRGTCGHKVTIVVVDTYKSSDNAAEICADNGINYIKSAAAQRACQMNEGAHAFPSTVYLFLHADVVPPKDFLRHIHSVVEGGSGFGLFAYQFDRSKWPIKVNAYLTKYDGIFCGGGDQCHFMTHDTFLKTGGYNTEYNLMEDFELFERIKKLKIPYSLIQDRATVSSRKYNHYSYLRINLVNLIAMIKFKLGYGPEKIKKFYSYWMSKSE